MSDLDTTITELEQELALKRAYQQVQFSWSKGFKIHPQVAEAVENKLREAAAQLALNPSLTLDDVPTTSPFNTEETQALKMLAQRVLAPNPSSVATTPQEKQAFANSVPTLAPGEKVAATPGGSTTHVPSQSRPRKAKILVAENIRGEAKKYAVPDDEIYISNPDKIDDHGMVSATHMKRGAMLRIPLDDVDFLE